MASVFHYWCIVWIGILSGTFADYMSFDILYEEGIDAYTGQNWKGTITSMEQAIASYKQYKNGLSQCYMKCNNASSGNELIDESAIGHISYKATCTKDCLDEQFGDYKLIGRTSEEVKQNLENLMPYQYLQYAYYQEGMLAESVSAAYTYNLRFPENEMMKNNMKFFREREDVTEEMYVNSESKEHLIKYNQAAQAYLKEDYVAASALFEETLVEYYKAVDDCHGLCEGQEAAQEEQWKLDFYRQNAYHYINVLECSLKCVRNLSSDVADQQYPNFLPLHYHSLQFAYYQIGEFRKSVESAKSYLLFYPNDVTMTENLDIMLKMTDVSKINPCKKAQRHQRRMTLEARMLKYSYQNFGIRDYDRTLLKPFGDETQRNDKQEIDDQEGGLKGDVGDIDDQKWHEKMTEDRKSLSIQELQEDGAGDENGPEESDNRLMEEADKFYADVSYQSMKEKTDDIINQRDIEVEQKMADDEQNAREAAYAELKDDVDLTELVEQNPRPGFRVVDSKYLVSFDESMGEDSTAEGPIIFQGATLLANSTQLRGRERFAIDGLATEEDCLNLIDLGVSFAQAGDGYQGKASPHTAHEKFEGLSLLKTANMAKEGLVPLSAAKLYYDLSEKARAQVQAYFKLPALYFDFTHLVCRTAKFDSPADRNDLSHPVHADNCILQNNGKCAKELPAYIWRDYSAILYLNTDFVGGEFIFADSTARRVRTSVKPKCGRMVSFGAGGESLHGVKSVQSGRRCAIALWFTLSEDEREKNRIEAKKILDELSSANKDEL